MLLGAWDVGVLASLEAEADEEIDFQRRSYANVDIVLDALLRRRA